MSPIDVLKRRWQQWTGEEETPLDGDTPAWLISLGFHLLMLVLLALMWRYRPDNQVHLVLSTVETEESQRAPEEFEYSNQPNVEIGSNSLAGVGAALAMAPKLEELPQLRRQDMPADLALDAEPQLYDFSAAPTLSENLEVKGAAGEGATGASGAIDRITQEILDSLAVRRTLVVWILDQSLSMQAQREEIAERFERIYTELGVIDASGNPAFAQHSGKPLLSSIMAFGKEVSFRTKEPTDDLNELRSAVEGIENDFDGTEMVFTAVGMAAKKYHSFRTKSPRRNVMIIIASDEVGDDEHQMELALSLCRRQEMPVYCIGIPAPFGRREVDVMYVDPDPNYDQSVQMLPVRQGPESVMPEAVQLSFRGGDYRELDRFDSGFGPFALTRLCYETGGIYFAVRPNRDGGRRRGQLPVVTSPLQYFFDPAIMRSYQPEYISIKEYERRLERSKARRALVQAAARSMVSPMENPRLEFPKQDEASFKRSLDEAQQLAAKIGPKIDALYQTLKAGEVDRSKLPEPRWRAGFDLAMGRVLAVKVRTEGYNAMLAKAKSGLKFEKPESDTFVLLPANEISVSSALDKMARQAREYLERVRTEHAGTPWAVFAERELKEPIGWKWSEKVSNIARARMAAGNGGSPAPPAPEALRKLPKPKPKRDNIRL